MQTWAQETWQKTHTKCTWFKCLVTFLLESSFKLKWNIKVRKINIIATMKDISFFYRQVVIRRRPLFYTVNLLLPSIFLMVMDIVGFYLPPDSGERVSFKITLLLGYSVFLIIVSDTLPATAIGTPLIGNELFLIHRTWPDAFQKVTQSFFLYFLIPEDYYCVWEVTCNVVYCI